MGDTTGAGTPASVTAMLEATARAVPIRHVAAHLHDTYGQVRQHSHWLARCLDGGVPQKRSSCGLSMTAEYCDPGNSQHGNQNWRTGPSNPCPVRILDHLRVRMVAQAVANAVAAMQVGVSTLDSSVAGLGGCPYAKGATGALGTWPHHHVSLCRANFRASYTELHTCAGNVATEDLVYLLSGLGIAHGVDMDRLLDASQYISLALGREPHSRVARALLAKRVNTAVAVAA